MRKSTTLLSYFIVFVCIFWHFSLLADELVEAREALNAKQLSTVERILRPYLELHPDSDEARYLLARALAWQSRQVEARREYIHLLKSEPNNSDYMLGLAQTHMWEHRAEAALPLLIAARAIAPTNTDIYHALIKTLQALGKNEEALRMQNEAQVRFPHQIWNDASPIQVHSTLLDTAMLNLQSDEIDRKFNLNRINQIEVGLSHENLSKGIPSWRSQFVNFEHSFAPRLIAYTSLHEYNRFNLTDHELLAGLYYPINSLWTLNIEGNFSPESHVVAKYSSMATLQREFEHGWNLTGGIR